MKIPINIYLFLSLLALGIGVTGLTAAVNNNRGLVHALAAPFFVLLVVLVFSEPSDDFDED